MATACPPSVMVVEDDAALLETMVDVLSWHRWPIVGAAQDNVGAMHLASYRPDIALVDYELKDGPSDALIELLQAQNVNVLIFSGYARDHLPSKFRRHAFLLKPFDVLTLMEALAQLDPQHYRITG